VGTGYKRWLALGVLALIVAAGLVALGRWTAPSSAHKAQVSSPSSQVVRGGPGSIAPAVMPPRGMLQTLEHIYLGTPLSSSSSLSGYGPGSIAPAVMPPRGVLQTLQHIYLGTPLPANAPK
jgi:hypothetical protein